MITSDQVDALIFRALDAINAEREPDEQIKPTPTTALFGIDAELDSLSFVSLIADVEESLILDYGLTISLADDRALAREESPYASVETLRDYILELAAEQP